MSYDLTVKLGNKRKLRNKVIGIPYLLDQCNDIGSVGIVGAFTERTQNQRYYAFIILMLFRTDRDPADKKRALFAVFSGRDKTTFLQNSL